MRKMIRQIISKIKPGVSKMEKNVDKAAKLELIENLKLQAKELRKSGHGGLADQNERIAARLKRRLDKLDKLKTEPTK